MQPCYHLCHHPPTFKTKPRTFKHQSGIFSLIHSNGCCITHSDKSGARPSPWQHHSLPQLLIQQPTMGQTELEVRTLGSRKSAYNINKDHMLERLILTKAEGAKPAAKTACIGARDDAGALPRRFCYRIRSRMSILMALLLMFL